MNTGFFSSRSNQILGAVALFMLIVALASYSVLNFKNAKTAGEYPANVSVEGIGKVSAVPDVAQFSFSVNATGATAEEAQAASATSINNIIAYLKEQGIEEKDIKTENYNLYPKYRYEERMCAFGSYCPPGEQVQDGFEISQSVTVKVRDKAKAGEIIAGIGSKGATNISGLSFVIDDKEALKAEARTKAIADAKAKADKLASDLGVKIVRITSYYENEGYYPEPYYAKTMEMAADEGYGGGSAEMPAGEQEITVSVSVSYEIKERRGR